MRNLENFINKWTLTNVTPLAQTPRGNLFKCDHEKGKAVLKIYTGAGINEEYRGVEFLEVCSACPIVNVFEKDENAVLLEFCDGVTLDSMVQDGDDNGATEIIAKTVMELHKCKIPEKHNFLSLEQRFKPIKYAADSSNDTDEKKLFNKALKIAEELVNNQDKVCMLHGDVHHANIINDSRNGWTLIDPKGCIGDPAYDFANLFLNPWEMTELVRNKKRVLTLSKKLEECTGFSQLKILKYAFVDTCLSHAWFLEEGESSQHARTIMSILSSLV